MVPEPVPAREAVAVSGVAEILGGLAVLHPASRRLGRWWLLALLLAVFPANVHMAVNPEQIRGLDLNKVPRWAALGAAAAAAAGDALGLARHPPGELASRSPAPLARSGEELFEQTGRRAEQAFQSHPGPSWRR